MVSFLTHLNARTGAVSGVTRPPLSVRLAESESESSWRRLRDLAAAAFFALLVVGEPVVASVVESVSS